MPLTPFTKYDPASRLVIGSGSVLGDDTAQAGTGYACLSGVSGLPGIQRVTADLSALEDTDPAALTADELAQAKLLVQLNRFMMGGDARVAAILAA